MGKALQPKVQASLSRRSQIHLKIPIPYRNRLILTVFVFESGTRELVLAKGTGLQQNIAACHWVRIHQRQTNPVSADLIN